MAATKFTDLSIGDKFVIHTIKFARKVDKSYVRGQIRYIRAKVLVQDMDDVDDLILKAIRLKYPQAKNMISVESVMNMQKYKYTKLFQDKYHLQTSLHIQRNEHLDFENKSEAYATTEISFPITLFCDAEYKNNFIEIFETFVFVGDNKLNEIKNKINKTLIEYDYFFS